MNLLVAPALIGLAVRFTQAVPAGTIRAEKKVRVAINGASVQPAQQALAWLARSDGSC
jgi:hypothetical protein